MGAPEDLVAISPREAAQVGATSLTKYGHLFFPRTFRMKSPEMHEAIGAALYGPDRYNAFEIFRDGAKTSLLRVYTSQRIAYGISRTIMFTSASQEHSKISVRWLRRQVMYNKRWAQTFGLSPGDKWTDEWCEVKCNLLEDEHQPGMPVVVTLLAMGITGQIRGFNMDDFRPDLIVLDDPLTDENTATEEQRKKIEMLIFGALLNSLAPSTEVPTAKAVFLQTPFNKDDAISKCMNDPQWNPLKFGIIEYLSNGKMKSRWEDRYPLEQVLKEKEAHIRRSQYRLWMREKECAIVAGEEKAIDVSRFRYWDVLPEGLDKIISVDPASSESPHADKHISVLLGFRGLDVYLIAGARAEKNQPDKATNDFFNLVLLGSPRKGVVESNAYQRVFKWILEQEMTKRRLYVMVDLLEVKTKNADRIMQTIPGTAAYGHLHIHPSMTEFIQEADEYDPQVKDISDDWLTAVANGIIAGNPALRLALAGDSEVGGELLEHQDESAYKPLRIGGAP